MAEKDKWRSMSQEELDRMGNHITDCLIRAGMSAATLNQYTITYMAHFIQESRIAPIDSNMALIYRTMDWCREAMNG